MSLAAFKTLAEDTYNYTTTTPQPVAFHVSPGLWVAEGIFAIPTIIGLWKVFTKAGKPGWASIIPIYNYWVIFELGDKPGWWAILMVIPIVNIIGLVLYIMALVNLSKHFGKSGAYAILLLFLPFIGFPMLGFSDAQYNAGAQPVV